MTQQTKAASRTWKGYFLQIVSMTFAWQLTGLCLGLAAALLMTEDRILQISMMIAWLIMGSLIGLILGFFSREAFATLIGAATGCLLMQINSILQGRVTYEEITFGILIGGLVASTGMPVIRLITRTCSRWFATPQISLN